MSAFYKIFKVVLSLVLVGDAAFADTHCEELLFGHRHEYGLQRFVHGEKAFGEAPDDFEIDRQTASDLQLDRVATILDPYLYSEMGKMRWRHRLSHPLLDSEAIRKQQEMVRYIADHPDDFKEIREYMEKNKELTDGFAEDFEKLTFDPDDMRFEAMYAGLTYMLLASAKLSQWLSSLVISAAAYLQFFKGNTWGTSFGYSNAQNKVGPKRSVLIPFRRQFFTARLGVEALAKVPEKIVGDLRESLGVIYEGPDPELRNKAWLAFNAWMNPVDKDIVEPKVVKAEGLSLVHRKLRMLERDWRIKIPFTNFNPKITDFTKSSDLFHISNFLLPRLRREVILNRDEIARVFSAVAELEVLLGMANYYNAHREHMIFPEILDRNQPTEFVAKQVHHPALAIQGPEFSIGNDIVFGDGEANKGHAFTISFSQPGGGSTTYQQTAAVNQLFAQTGMPWFAQEGRITPGLLMTALDLRASLSGSGTNSFKKVEARRISAILRMSEYYPHSFTYLSNPFADASGRRAVAMQAATIHRLIESRTLGIMSTHGQAIFRIVKDDPRLSLMHVKDFVARPFDSKLDFETLSAEKYFASVSEDGLPGDLVEEARALYSTLSPILFKAEN